MQQGVVTARASVTRREGRILHGQATLCDDSGRALAEFFSTFKLAQDTRIRAVEYDDAPPKGENL
jgi:hypothetical protein